MASGAHCLPHTYTGHQMHLEIVVCFLPLAGLPRKFYVWKEIHCLRAIRWLFTSQTPRLEVIPVGEQTASSWVGGGLDGCDRAAGLGSLADGASAEMCVKPCK